MKISSRYALENENSVERDLRIAILRAFRRTLFGRWGRGASGRSNFSASHYSTIPSFQKWGGSEWKYPNPGAWYIA